MRDQHAGCVGSYLVEHDLFDFLLLSLPDNDAHSHKYGPHAQFASIAAADAELWRVMEAGGGAATFLDEHAMIVMADHSHSHIERVVDFTGAYADWKVLRPSGTNAGEAEIALCPAQRSAMIYLLHQARGGALGADRRRPRARSRASTSPCGARTARAHVAGERGELRSRRATLSRTTARAALGRRRRPRRAAGDDRGRPLRQRALPRRAAARVVGARVRDLRRRAAVGRAGLRVPRLGQARPRARRQPRLAAPRRLARRADVQRHSTAAPNGPWSIDDIAPMVLAHFGAG